MGIQIDKEGGNPWDNWRSIARESMRELGFWMTLRYLLIYWLSYKPVNDRSYDNRYGTDTSGIIPTRNLDIDDAYTRWQANLFLASPARITRYMIEQLIETPGDYTFVDYGSGKGRTTLVAAEYPFKKAIGVEISAELTAVARKNAAIRAERGDLQCDTGFVCADARTFELPSGNLLLHMYHPFGQDILREVLSHIRDTAGNEGMNEPRRILLPYLFSVAMAKAVFHEFPEFERQDDVFCVNPQYRWTLYEFKSGATSQVANERQGE